MYFHTFDRQMSYTLTFKAPSRKLFQLFNLEALSCDDDALLDEGAGIDYFVNGENCVSEALILVPVLRIFEPFAFNDRTSRYIVVLLNFGDRTFQRIPEGDW